MPQKKKISLITLGCPKNVVDSEMFLKQIEANNCEIACNHEESDIVVINTCGFINSAKEESIDTIIESVKLKQAGRIKKLIVMGCLSERYADELKREIPEVDVFIGVNRLRDVAREINVPWREELLGERSLITPSHYAYLKISEGCDRPCSFCAIPAIRGPNRSVPIEQLEDEAKKLAAKGVKELIVIAQDTTYYGVDIYGKRSLARLLNRLSEIDGFEWIRLMYAYPSSFPHDVIEIYQRSPKLCRYVDLPLQHIADPVLSSMKRGICKDEIYKLVNKLRSKIPGIALRTTFIVGYPTEGENEFRELLEFVEEMKFERLGVFTYSREDGTAAYELGDPVPILIKEERYAAIMELQHKIAWSRNRDMIGKKIRVLVDNVNNKMAVGRSEFDAPEIDNEVLIKDKDGIVPGFFYTIEIHRTDAYDMEGKSCGE